MKTVKQSIISTCLAACIATITNKTEHEVLYGKDHVILTLDKETQVYYVSMSEAFAYLAKNHWFINALWANPPKHEDNFSSRMGLKEFYVEPYLHTCPAIVIVDSPHLTGRHAIVYDHKLDRFRDPDASVEDLTDWEDYKIYEWWPLTRII